MPLGVRENVEDADWLHLSHGERIRWTGRPSLFTIAAPILIGLLLGILGVLLAIRFRPIVDARAWPPIAGYVPLLVTAVGIGIAALAYLNWLRLLYVVTDEEIYVKIGLVSRDVTQVRLDRVQNTSYTQSVLERLLSYGDVVIYTAGTGTEDLTLESVPNPERVQETLTRLLSERGTRRRPENEGL